MTRTTFESLKQLWTDEAGGTSVEYAMLVAVVVVVGIPAWTGLRSALLKAMTSATSKLAQ